MSVAYPGLGRQLTLATYPGTGAPALVTYPETAIIPDGDYSNWEAVNDAQNIQLTIIYDSAPGAVTTIELSPDPSFDIFTILDTIPLSTDLMTTWTSAAPVQGLIRINNTSGEQIDNVYVQKQVASVG